MKIDYDALAYEMPWRRNYEGDAALGWFMASGLALGVNQISAMPAAPFLWMTGICGIMAAARLPKAIRLYNLQKHLSGRELEFCKLEDLKKQMSSSSGDLWLGHGFNWETTHAQRVFEILKRDWASFATKEQMGGLLSLFHKRKPPKHAPMGQPWIHGVEPKEKKLNMPLAHNNLHTLIVGSTGSGKTRMFDIFITQAILRSPQEAIIIIDPKGDHELCQNARRACIAMGKPERFVEFNPAFPERSARLDPLRNFSRVTEIASRLSALIQSQGGAGSDPFKSFAWQALNNIAQGLVIAHDRPTLVLLKRFLEGGAAGLVIKAVKAYAERNLGADWEAQAASYYGGANNSLEKQANGMMRFYHEIIQPEYPSSDLEGLLSMYKHDATHFSKMVSNLLPIMNMLTSGEMGKLLSPDPYDLDDDRPITDTAKIIRRGQVVYIGLDSLTDGMVGSAIGSIFLSDLTAVAGDRYNYGCDEKPVNLFVDEAAEVVNDPFIQILNKGRGAGFSTYVATQTFADFASRLGSKDKAVQVLSNVNNLFALRTIDTETQTYITENLPKTRLKYVMRTQGQNTDSEHPLLHGGNQGERLMEEEADLFPPQLLGMLPNLEYIAKVSGGRIIKGRLPILTA